MDKDHEGRTIYNIFPAAHGDPGQGALDKRKLINQFQVPDLFPSPDPLRSAVSAFFSAETRDEIAAATLHLKKVYDQGQG